MKVYTKKEITSSSSYIISIITLVIMSLLLAVALVAAFVVSTGDDIALFGGFMLLIPLLGLTFGVAKLNKISIYIWLSIISFLSIPLSIVFLYNEFHIIRRVFFFTEFFAAVLFLYLTLKSLISVLLKVNRLEK